MNYSDYLRKSQLCSEDRNSRESQNNNGAPIYGTQCFTGRYRQGIGHVRDSGMCYGELVRCHSRGKTGNNVSASSDHEKYFANIKRFEEAWKSYED